MAKEIFLIVIFCFSLLLIYKTLPKINGLPTTKAHKAFLTYFTLIVPILGFILVSRFKPTKTISV